MSIFQRFQLGLAKTGRNFKERLQGILGAGKITDDLLEELEAVLLESDAGMDATIALVEMVKERNRLSPITEDKELFSYLKMAVEDIMKEVVTPLSVANTPPTVYIMVGVNGSGKTTTIGKLANRWTREGKSVLLAAADTFRAAAEDQLAVWAKRSGANIISHQSGSDPGAVVFDAMKSAIARNTDLVLVDTAGRLHTKKNLIEEMKKIVRVVKRELPAAPHETILVLDGTTGQNGLRQAMAFKEAVDVTGICLTKLDGSSKGGIALGIAKDLGIPIKLLGMGEGIDDLLDFDPSFFAESMFPGY